jgi:hypothetical protein
VWFLQSQHWYAHTHAHSFETAAVVAAAAAVVAAAAAVAALVFVCSL